MMNLYNVTVKGDLVKESYYIAAGSAKVAIDKAYRRFDKDYNPTEMLIVNLELIQEKF